MSAMFMTHHVALLRYSVVSFAMSDMEISDEGSSNLYSAVDSEPRIQMVPFIPVRRDSRQRTSSWDGMDFCCMGLPIDLGDDDMEIENMTYGSYDDLQSVFPMTRRRSSLKYNFLDFQTSNLRKAEIDYCQTGRRFAVAPDIVVSPINTDLEVLPGGSGTTLNTDSNVPLSDVLTSDPKPRKRQRSADSDSECEYGNPRVRLPDFATAFLERGRAISKHMMMSSAVDMTSHVVACEGNSKSQ